MDDKVRFLLESFNLIGKTQANAERVYAFWRMNTDKIDGLSQIMPNIALQILAVEGQGKREGVALFGSFGYLIQGFPSGNRRINLDLAITSYQICTKIFTQNEDPSTWASYQYNLGTAYLDRIEGEHKANIELAIDAFQVALKVKTRQVYPHDWARIQYGLGSAYLKRIEGNRKENIEQAIQSFQAFLEIYNRSDSLDVWSKLHSDLLLTYRDWIQGEREEDLEPIIDTFRAALEIYNHQDFPVEWARTQYILGIAYCARTEGDRKRNLTQAIDAFRAALEVYSFSESQIICEILESLRATQGLNSSLDSLPESKMNINLAAYYARKGFPCPGFPLEYSTIQDDLEIACYDILEAEREGNLEQVIQPHNPQNFPVQQTTAQNELDNVDRDRKVQFLLESLQLIADSQGNPERVYKFWQMHIDKIDESLIQIIPDVASQIFEVESKKEQGAIARLFGEFGYLLRMFPLGHRGINAELAITACKICDKIFTRNDYPVEWAITQGNLGDAYRDRIKGERKENIELAIQACWAALEVHTRQDFPVDWARIQYSLGNAFRNRIAGDPVQNLEQAIQSLRATLEVFTRQASSIRWALVQNSLGNAYRNRIAGNRVQNLEQAIQAYRSALEVYTQQNFPSEWAMTENNLGNAYKNLIEVDCKENVEQAIQAYRSSLEVYTEQAFPVQWASTQNNLGLAYCVRTKGDRQENIKQALQAFRASLKVRQPELMPLDCMQTGSNLGNLAFKEGDWNTAIEGFEKAITAVEKSRSWAKSDRRRQEIIDQSIDIYEKMLQSCINANRLDKALQTVEHVRSKRLVDLMAALNLYPQGKIPEPVRLILKDIANVQQKMDDLRAVAQTSASELAGAETRDRAAVAPPTVAIHALERQKQDLIDELSRYDAVSAQLVEITPPNLSHIQTTLVNQPDIALLSFYTTNQDTHILVVRSDSIQCFTCKGQGFEQLQRWLINEWVRPYIEERTNWVQNMPQRLQQLAAKLELARLVAEHLQDTRELILIPHLYLHLIPFAALPLNGNQQYFGDRFLLRYAPGCQVLKFCTDRNDLPPQQRYGTVENTMEDLPFSAIEGEAIAQIFKIEDANRLRGSQEATSEAYKQLLNRINSVASCHHAQSRLDNPLESALILANGKRVTLGELLSPAWRFADLGDVFLSCCETGMTMPKSLTDELLTLGTGFLCAGARSVISSLWAVSDIATALLSQIYHQSRAQGQNRIVALQKAQQDLRRISGEQLKAKGETEFIPALMAQQEQLEQRRRTARRQKQQVTSDSEAYRQWEVEEKRYSELIDRLEHAIMYLEDLWEKSLPFDHPVYWAPFTCQGLR